MQTISRWRIEFSNRQILTAANRCVGWERLKHHLSIQLLFVCKSFERAPCGTLNSRLQDQLINVRSFSWTSLTQKKQCYKRILWEPPVINRLFKKILVIVSVVNNKMVDNECFNYWCHYINFMATFIMWFQNSPVFSSRIASKFDKCCSCSHRNRIFVNRLNTSWSSTGQIWIKGIYCKTWWLANFESNQWRRQFTEPQK